MPDTLPPQPQTDTPIPWPSSLDFMALQAALASDPGPLTYPDPPSVYSSEQTGPNDYTFYKIQHVYADESGTDVWKTGSADASKLSFHTVVQMHQPFTELRILWTAQRWGAKPKRPSKDLKNPNCIYIRSVFSTMNALQLPNGVLHRISGIYLYKLLVSMDETDTYPTGVTPAETATSVDNARMYGPDDIDNTLLDATGGVPTNVVFPTIIVEDEPTQDVALPAPIHVPPR